MKSHHTVELEVGIEPDRSVSAVEGEGDIGHICPPTLLKSVKLLYCLLFVEFIGGFLSFAGSQIRGGRK